MIANNIISYAFNTYICILCTLTIEIIRDVMLKTVASAKHFQNVIHNISSKTVTALISDHRPFTAKPVETILWKQQIHHLTRTLP